MFCERIDSSIKIDARSDQPLTPQWQGCILMIPDKKLNSVMMLITDILRAQVLNSIRLAIVAIARSALIESSVLIGAAR